MQPEPLEAQGDPRPRSHGARPCRQWEIPRRAATTPDRAGNGQVSTMQPQHQTVQAMGNSQPRSHSAGANVQRGIPGRDAPGRAGQGKFPAAQPQRQTGPGRAGNGKFPAAQPQCRGERAEGNSRPRRDRPCRTWEIPSRAAVGAGRAGSWEIPSRTAVGPGRAGSRKFPAAQPFAFHCQKWPQRAASADSRRSSSSTSCMSAAVNRCAQGLVMPVSS